MYKFYKSPERSTSSFFRNALEKKTVFGLLFLLFSIFTSQAQISVSVTNPGNTSPSLAASYVNLSSALTDLNAVTAMTGPVTLTLTGSETAPATGFTLGSASLNAVLSSTNTITLVASGTVTINAGTGTATPASAAPDGMLKLVGADYVTLDGITFTDGNSASATVAMEYGVGLFKLSASDGCNNNTIRNCIFNMQRVNNTAATSPMVDGAVGILVINATAAAATTALTPTVAAGSNSNNKFYTNTINGGNIGIALSGFAATAGVGPTPTASTFLGDLSNDIGGSTSGTGNTILNFGGAAAAANPAAGIRANNQWSVNISNNTINNNNGSGANHVTTLRGIYAQAGTSANATISNNTVTVKSGATTSALTAIDNGIGSTAASNTITITGNIITNNAYTTSTTGTFTGILSSATAANVNINSNQIINSSIGTSATANTCVFQAIYNSAGSTNYTVNSNTINNITLNNSFGTFYGIRGSTSVINVDGNTISNISMPNSTGATSSVMYGYYDGSSPPNETVTNNNINNFSINGSSTATGHVIYGIYNLTAVGAKVLTGNNINNLSFTSSSNSGYATVAGIRNAYNTVATISKNVIHTLSSTGTGPTVAGLYLGSSSATTYNVSNNIIGNLSTPQSTGLSLFGIFCGTVGSNINLYYNTVYLNGTSSGTGFASAAVYQSSTTPTVLMNNNILVNLSTPTGTGISSCFRRTSTTLTQYNSASNNNLFYAGTPSATKLLFYDGTNSVQTMSAYKTLVSPREALSFSEAVSSTAGTFFQSLTGPASGSSATFLHLVNGLNTQAESGGIAISGITDDYDGNTRNASNPDVGADEFAGVSPAPAISITSVTPPATSQCTASGRAVNASITTASGTITSATLNYSFNGVAQSPITMTAGGGSSYTATIPVGSPTTATVAWSITAVNSVPLSATYTGTSYADDPLAGGTASASASVTTTCAGTPTVLTASFVKSGGTATNGTGLTTIGTTSTSEALSPFSQYYESQHTQYLVMASDLQAAGLAAGNITGLRFNVATKNSTLPFTSYTIKLATTALTTLTSGNNAATFTTVYASSSTVGTGMSTTAGTNNFNFGTGAGTSSSFNWDGTSNILVDICFANDPASTGALFSNTDLVTATTKSYTATYGYNQDNANLCGATYTNVTNSTKLPDMTFVGVAKVALSGISWSDGASTVGTGNNLSVSPTTGHTYTFTANYSGCPVSASTPVTVNPAPTSLTGTNSSQCGLDIPTASVSDPNGFATPIIKWYATNVATTPLQATTSHTYGTAISTTTTFYVSVVNPTSGCESARIPVTVTVSTPASITVTPGATATVCSGQSISLGASSTNAGYVYSWTANPTTGSGVSGTLSGASQTITPTMPGTYVYTVLGDDGICATTNTVTVTAGALPAITTAAAASGTICAGGSTALTATSIGIGAGTGTIGTQTTTIGGDNGNPYRSGNGTGNQIKTQLLYKASELTAAGYAAGNITSLGFTVTGADTGVVSNFTIKMANSSATALTTTYETPTFTTVFTQASFTPAVGVNTHTFSTPFVWDGTSNIIVETCQTNNVTGTTTVACSTPAFAGNTHTASSTTACSATTGTAVANRPIVTLGGQKTTDITSSYTWTWNPGNLSGASVSVSPTTTTAYTVRATNTTTGCYNEQVVNVTVNPKPTALTATNSSQCGLQVPTASVADPNGFTTPTIKWYADNVTTTALQSSTSMTYDTAISTTTTFYVSVVNPATGCESNRTAVTVTVTTPNAITVTPGATATICLGNPITLGASSAGLYSYTWSVSPSLGSGMSGTPSGASQTVTPTAAGTYVYTVTGTDGVCTATNTVTVTVGALPAITSVTAPATASCPGTAVALSAKSIAAAPGTAAIGTQTTTEFGGGVYRNGFGTGDFKHQLIYTAAELSAAGLQAGNITAVSFNVTSAGSGSANNYTIRMANVASTPPSTTSFLAPAGYTTCYTAATYTAVAGVNTHTFTTPFNWDGTSNVLVDICYNISTIGTSSTLAATTPSAISNNNLLGSTGACAATTGATTYANRPLATFAGQVGSDMTSSYTWTWNPGNLSGASVSASPTTTTVYTVRATNAATGCFSEQNVTVNVNPAPTAPTVVTSASQCGTQVPAASVSDPNGFTTPVIRWYNVATGGSPLQATTSTSYNSAISVTTTFYVAVVNPTTGCESARTPLTITVSTPDSLSITAPSSLCAGGSFNISSSYTPSFNNFTQFTLSATPATGSGVTGNVALTANATGSNAYLVTPTAAGTYVYTISAYDPNTNCTSVQTKSITVNALPALTVSATPATICAGSATTLLATTTTITAGTATSIGADTTTTVTTGITPFTSNYEGQHIQYIVRASELTASGLNAGNLTSLAFNVTASGVGTYAQSGYTVKIANTADTAFSGNFATPSGSFTTVYGPVSKPAPAVGLHTLTFTTPFNWDGVSNIVIDICHDNDSVADTCASCFSGNSTVAYSTTAYNSVYGKYADNNSLCGTTNGTAITTFTNRPNMIFGGQVVGQAAGSLSYSWSDGASTVSSSNTFSASPSATTVYTVTATDPATGCAKVQNVTVNVNPAPNAPSVVNGGHCGAGVVTAATVSNTNGFTTPTYKWYSASTGGTALQSSTATNYTTSIATTTTFYVSVVNPTSGCESARSMIVLTIDTMPSATIHYDNSPYCNTLTSATVTRTGTAGGSYTADLALSLNTATGEVNPSLSTPGLYQVTYTMDGGSCGIQTATTFITIGQNPNSGFTYGSSVYCSSSLTATPAITGTAGTFTATPAGLAINASTGVIDLVASTEGTYTVTNTVTGAGCTPSTTNATVTVNKAVAITAQPQGVSILPADNTSFSVTATGTGISSYVWEVNDGSGWATVADGGVYSGATTNTLSLTNVTSGMNQYQYRVTVSGTAPCAAVTSDPAVLTVTSISINAQPQSQTICSNSGVTFFVTTSGGTPSSYQWQYRVNSAGTFADIPSATSSSYSIPSGLTSANTGNQYQVVINGGSLVSNVATLTVNDVVAINTNPATQTVCSSAASVTFTVGATGTGLTYQWELSTDNGGNWSPISAATTASYTINTPAVSLTGNQYRAVVSGLAPCSAQTSTAATLTVIQAVAITAQPANQAICASATANFSVTATGAGLTYQWIANNGSDIILTDGTLSGATISGATTNALSIASASSLSGYTFRVQVTGTAPCAPLTSNTVSLYVVSGGTIAVGPSGTYNNLTSAIAALVTCGITQPTFLELNSGYDASTETYPISMPAITGASATNTITIREANGVTGKVISSANPVATFSLNGGNYWTIDGRSGGTGSNKDLQISNTNTTGAVIQFINDASNNIVRYADVRGVNTSATSGVVLFSTTTATTGNDNNTIANCDIRDGATTPVNGIYSAGTAAKTNDNNTISNNNIFNFFSATLATKGIAVASNSEAWTISGNKLYQTATRIYTTANTHNGINVASGAGYTITGNTIGFANAAGTGTMNLVGNTVALTGTFPSAYTTTGTANATRFIGINAGFTAAGTVSSIQNNTVAGIALYTSSGATTTNGVLCGINVTSGNANIGTATGNTIGATTGMGSLYAASTTSQAAVVGIYATSANTVAIQNNTIGAIDASGTTASLTGSVTGIDVAGSGVMTVSNNIVGNTTANNLRGGAFFNGTNLTNSGALTFTTSGATLIEGIRSAATGTSTTISSNTVRNATAYGTGASIVNGVDNTGAATLLTVGSNTITDIANAGTGAFTGMTVGSPTTVNVTSNTINNLSRTAAATFYGIQYGTPTTVTIDGNTVSNLANNAAGSTSGFYGIYSVGTPQNETITNNNVFGLSTTATGAQTMVGWYQLTSNTGTKVCTGNNFYNFTAPASSAVVMYGIRNGYGANVTISRNTIYGFAGGLTQFGIYSAPSIAGTANIFRNKIYDLSTGNTGAAQIIGLAMASTTASANTNAYDNLIGDLRTPAASNADAIRGISVSATAATANFNVYNNTVYLNASSTGAAFGTSGIYHAASSTATTAKLDLMNNIVINTSTPGTTGVVTALRRSAVATLGNFATTSNRNMYFAGTPAANKAILYDGTNAYQDYSTYYAAVGTSREANSFVDTAFSAASFFNSTTGGSATYLKPNDGINTLAESGGANLSAFFTVDYNGVTRGTQYDMGAWEFAGSSPAPTVTFNSVSPAFTTLCTATARTVSVDVTTPTGTITGVTITYNNGTATGPVAMTNTSGNTWSYTIPAASPANSVVTWSVTATNSSSLSTGYTGTSYQDALNTGVSLVASASLTTVCSGTGTILNASFNGIAPTYTAPPAVTNPTTDEDMGNVTITQGATTILNNASARNSLVGTIGTATGTAGSYANYTAFGPYVLNGGGSYNFSMTSVQDASAFAHSMAIYIDYNRNGSFGDAGEAVYTSAATTLGAHTETGSFVVPAGVSPGNARMRIIVTEGAGGITGPTMTVGWGEYEEYMVNLQPSVAYSWSDGSTVVGTTKSLTVNPTTTTTYTLTTTVNSCPVVSNGVTVTVNPPSVAGTISGAATVCSGTNSTTLTLNGNTGTIQWQSSSDNTTFANISGATGSTYTAQNLTATTYYRAVVTSGLCTAATSTSVAVTVDPVSNGGSVTGGTTICSGSASGLLTLGTHTGTIVRWESSVSPFTTWSPIANTTSTYTSGTLTQTTQFRAVVQSGTCPEANSASTTVTVDPVSNGGSVTGGTTICSGSMSGQLTLTGNTGTIVRWESSVSPFTTWSPIANTTSTYTSGALTQTTQFRAVVQSGACAEANSTSTTVTVDPASNGGTVSGGTTICSGSMSGQLTLTGNTGTVVRWESSVSPFTTWSPIANTTNTYTSGALTQTTQFRAVVQNGACGEANAAAATVTVSPASVGGSVSGGSTTCNGSSSVLTLSGHTGAVVRWESSVSPFTTWSPIAHTGTTYMTGPITVETHFRAVVQSGPCASATSSETIVTVGGNTTTWSAGAWSNGTPNSLSAAIINGNFTAVADLNACTLTIQSGTVTVSGGFDFYVNGKVTVSGGSLTFEDGSDLVQSQDIANTGNIKYKRTANLIRQDYVYWSSPVSGQLLQPFSPNTLNTRFYNLDEPTNAFVQIASPSTTSFDAAKGYMIRSANNHPTTLTPWTGTFTGVPRNGEYTIPVTVSGQGYNMIGNPYPSTVDADLFLAEPGNAGTLYFWTHISQAAASGANYATYNTLGGTAAQSGGTAPTGAIRGGQGFILLKSSASTARFTNAMRTAEGGAFYRSAQTAEKHRMWFNLNTPAHAMNQILVGYAEGATMGEDVAMDGRSIEGGSSISSLIGNDNYVIQARPLPFVDTDVVPLGFNAATAGTYIIELDHMDGLFSGDQNVYLKDNLLGVTHNIKQGAYSFASAEGSFANRFEVVYQSSPLGVDTPTFDANSVVVYKDQGMLHINSGKVVMSGVKIFDIRGRLIYERGAINASEAVLNDLRAEEQVLLVQITSVDNEVVTRKVAY
ncbi:Ig-like domain-containing protein [Flavobacterium pallidum]|uniref:Ig-like domain-containing protein n=1 Tax=Flavobacterium pallidum TaxID=2172098 RepID=A0A2S1SDY0_9FLAO|nr:GEVED domain-containing protein [Flavobacterium pallidum]AWI24595.1 hypothetical protein HYN49_01090 [Flavobacterium pallidum]